MLKVTGIQSAGQRNGEDVFQVRFEPVDKEKPSGLKEIIITVNHEYLKGMELMAGNEVQVRIIQD